MLDEYVFGRLSGEQLQMVERHLLVCEYCRTEAELSRQIVQTLRAERAQNN
jgi:anti-sigma factor RsiW